MHVWYVWSPEADVRHSFLIIESGLLRESPAPWPSTSQILRLQEVAIHIYALVDIYLNSGCHTCVTSVLSIEQSPQPL